MASQGRPVNPPPGRASVQMTPVRAPRNACLPLPGRGSLCNGVVLALPAGARLRGHAMPFVSHRGQRIHYTVDGTGPLVILQHGFFTDARAWKQAGFVSVLSDGYRVARIDSLGHGLSDKPDDPALYGQAQRAGDIVAVMDELGADRAHLLGYSMGGWMAIGVARYHPSRLATLTLGGWDPAEGATAGQPAGFVTPPFQEILDGARRAAPAHYAWITAEIEPALRACWDALNDRAGAEAALVNAGCPVLFWSGRDDLAHGAIEASARRLGFGFLSTPGDHNGAVMLYGDESARELRIFLDHHRV